MKVELTVLDFLRRAELVYGDRIGLVDEPGQPGGGLGEKTWKEVGRARTRAGGQALDELGIGVRASASAMVSHELWPASWSRRSSASPASAACFVPINFRLSSRAEIDLHRRAQRRLDAPASIPPSTRS